MKENMMTEAEKKTVEKLGSREYTIAYLEQCLARSVKLRRRKDGKTYDSIQEAVRDFQCPGPCEDCPLTDTVEISNGTYDHKCNTQYAEKHPEEIAEMIGCEVIWEDPRPEWAQERIRNAHLENPALCVPMTELQYSIVHILTSENQYGPVNGEDEWPYKVPYRDLTIDHIRKIETLCGMPSYDEDAIVLACEAVLDNMQSEGQEKKKGDTPMSENTQKTENKGWLVPITWMMSGYVAIPRELAATEKDAAAYVQAHMYEFKLPESGEYVSDSATCTECHEDVIPWDVAMDRRIQTNVDLDCAEFAEWLKRHLADRDDNTMMTELSGQMINAMMECAWNNAENATELRDSIKHILPDIPDAVLKLVTL